MRSESAAVLAVGNGITQRAAQSVEDGRLQQEGTDVVGLPLEYLLDQIVDDVPVVSGEGSNEPGRILAPPHRECGEL